MTRWDLYEQAIRHSTWAAEHGGQSNERLEFLGDAVLELAVTRLIFEAFPEAREGEMSRYRRYLVANRFLAARAREIGLGEALLMGRGEALGGGRDRQRNLANAYEALLAAIYLDQGEDAVRGLVREVFGAWLERAVDTLDPKEQLQHRHQRAFGTAPVYQVSQVGEAHAQVFFARVDFAGRAQGEGEGRSRKEAEREAARACLAALGDSEDG